MDTFKTTNYTNCTNNYSCNS